MLAHRIKEQILKRATAKGLPITTLEKEAGVNKGVVANIVGDKSKNPGIEILASIAHVLRCSIDDLIQPISKDDTILQPMQLEPTDYELIHDLFSKTFESIVYYIELKGYQASLNNVLFLIKEAYIFFLTKKNRNIDIEFIEWLVDKRLNKK